MKIIKIDGDCLNVFEINAEQITYISFANELDISRLGTRQIVLLLDYETYFDLDKRSQLLTRDLAHLKIAPSNIYSPYEAIGAYLKSQNTNIEGEIQVVDIEPDYCRSFTARFVDKRYTLSKQIKEDKKIPVKELFDTYFHKSASQIMDFEQFLETPDPCGKTFGLMVWESMLEHENGNNDYDDLIAAFDHKEWAEINIAHLVAFKTHLLRLTAIDLSRPYAITGLLSSILSASYSHSNRSAKLFGTKHLYSHSNQFYTRSLKSIALEVYCYPNVVRVPVFEANSLFEEYTVPRQIQLFDSGNVTLYRDNEEVKIRTENKPVSSTNLEIYLDGNQNLLVTAGSKSYLL